MKPLTRELCERLDAEDALAPLRKRFALPPGIVYLDGNSLGPLTAPARDRVVDVLTRQWGPDLIGSWNTHGWMNAPERIGARIARLVGAAPEDVVIADSTSVNLFKLVASWVRAAPGPVRLVTELGNFPTDLYVLQGVADLLGPAVRLAAVPRSEVLAALDGATSLLVLTHVHYKTAEMWDLDAVTALSHARGAAVLWDLSHSVGAVPVDLTRSRADLAVGCTYKYLNGGPGSPAFLYVRPDLGSRLGPGIAGWLGHESPFDFVDEYAPAAGARRHRVGTPGMLSLAGLDGSLDVFDAIDMASLRAKSVALTQLFIELVEQRCAGQGITVATPRDPERRGSHVALAHPSAYPIVQALIARGVIGDFRAPDIMRFGMTPLYTRFVDLWDAVEALHDVLQTGEWQRPEYAGRQAVT